MTDDDTKMCDLMYQLSNLTPDNLALVKTHLSGINVLTNVGIGQWLCGSVGRAVASDTRGPRFESSHRQNLLNICLLSTVN